MLSKPGEPLFFGAWNKAVFIHYETDAGILQRQIPFELDLRDGRAFVSIVAFTLVRMRPRLGGRVGEWLFKPIGTHEFLNIRTYVRHRGEPGIYFLVEWLSNPLSVRLGPRSFGLPYRFGRISYEHSRDGSDLRGKVNADDGKLAYEGNACGGSFGPCEAGSLNEFLLERYTAFTRRGDRARFFRVWHPPWSQASAEVAVTVDSLIASTGPWWKTAQPIGANHSPGVEVWMGRPHRIK
ncbi:MAG: uncharacterized protein QOH88_2308 [Verrucomicrobiota bacterium]